MKKYILESIDSKQKILQNEELIENLETITELICEKIKQGKKVLFAGNGGSASDCNHLATELVSRFYMERESIDAVSLCANNSLITAIANDYGYEYVFSRQLESHGKKGDILIALSTSGNSKNIIKAIKKAKEIDMAVIGFTGESKCDMDELCDFSIKVPSKNTPIIQESHIMLGHLICKKIEENLFL